MKRASRQHEATYSEVKRLLMELPFYWLNSNLYNAKNPVMLYDISTKSYNANDFLGGNIDMSEYSGFLIYYSDRAGGYQKSSYFTGKMSGMYQLLILQMKMIHIILRECK